jgi:hypothetical protein
MILFLSALYHTLTTELLIVHEKSTYIGCIYMGSSGTDAPV